MNVVGLPRAPVSSHGGGGPRRRLRRAPAGLLSPSSSCRSFRRDRRRPGRGTWSAPPVGPTAVSLWTPYHCSVNTPNLLAPHVPGDKVFMIRDDAPTVAPARLAETRRGGSCRGGRVRPRWPVGLSTAWGCRTPLGTRSLDYSGPSVNEAASRVALHRSVCSAPSDYLPPRPSPAGARPTSALIPRTTRRAARRPAGQDSLTRLTAQAPYASGRLRARGARRPLRHTPLAPLGLSMTPGRRRLRRDVSIRLFERLLLPGRRVQRLPPTNAAWIAVHRRYKRRAGCRGGPWISPDRAILIRGSRIRRDARCRAP